MMGSSTYGLCGFTTSTCGLDMVNLLWDEIESVESRKRRLGTKAIPCVLGEEGRIERL